LPLTPLLHHFITLHHNITLHLHLNLLIFSPQQDTGKVLNGEPMKRMSIVFKEFKYVITLDEAYLYIVKTNA
jgi:hypothetical protein